ncbi:MAG TPA: hypothetical protein VHC42_09500 [Rhizomicrobium sp.]|nr:hypothetical protein [Rhizomicrobium sp.]
MAQLVLPLVTNAALGREDFIVGPANAEAAAFIDRYPDWPSSVAAIFGPAGSGKSHLAAAWAASAGAAIVDAAALDAATAGGDWPAIAIENVDAAEPELGRDANLFTALERGAPVLLTGRTEPLRWRATMPDLASRYRAMLCFALWEPDEALLGSLARKLFADRQLSVPDAVVTQMLLSLERSPAAIRDFIARADVRALSERRPVSLGLVREMLRDQEVNTLKE